MTRLIFLLLTAFYGISANAYEGNPSEQVSQFFKELWAGNNAQAIDNLYSSNPLMSQKLQQLTLLKQQVGVIVQLYGRFIGTETLYSERLTPSLFRIVEVSKHEHHPVIWEFYFYKPKDKWIISQGKFNDLFKSVESKNVM